MKKPLLITSEYIKDEAGENMVKAALKPLIPHFDICMTTHSPMSKEIQSIVKYYVYDHRNEFVDPKLELDIWSDCPSFYFTFPQYMPPIHSYAVYRAYMNAVSLMKDYYEDFTYLESDCVLTEEDVERLKDLKKICERENKEALFFKNPNSSTSLLFFYCKMSFFEEIFPKLKTPQEYIDYCQKIESSLPLEDFIEKCIKINNASNRIWDAGPRNGYFESEKIAISTCGITYSDHVGNTPYNSDVVCVENSNELAFVYTCWSDTIKNEMEVFVDGEKVYTIPSNPHSCAIKINPKNEDFAVTVGKWNPRHYKKSTILSNKNIAFVRFRIPPIHLRNNFLHDYSSFIEHIASWVKPERYLEIGVSDGINMRKVQNLALECYGVDIQIRNRNYKENVKLFEMASDEFFKKLDTSIKFDMAFIDGDHEKNQVYKDFINLEHRMIDDGIILIHDSVPMNEGMLHPSFCNNAWEAVLKIKHEFLDKWEIMSLPVNPGITIMRKISISKQLIWK